MRLRLVIGKSDALDSAVEQGELDLALVPAYAGQTLRPSPRDRRLPDTVPGVGSDIKVDPANGPLIAGKLGAKRVEMSWLTPTTSPRWITTRTGSWRWPTASSAPSERRRDRAGSLAAETPAACA